MVNRVKTLSISAEALDKKNEYIKELETRLRLATPPEKAKQMRDRIEAMVAAIEVALSKACRGTRDMQQTRQLAIPQECLDGLRKAMQEPVIPTAQPQIINVPPQATGPKADERSAGVQALSRFNRVPAPVAVKSL